MKKPTARYWGFDTKTIDAAVRPQDDFYRYANGTWLRKNKIPADESRWGSFTKLRYDTDFQLKDLVEKLVKGTHKNGSDAQLVSDAFRAAVDMPLRNKLGIAPLKPLQEKIRSIESLDELLKAVYELHSLGLSSFWNSFVDQDFKNSSRYAFFLLQGGLGLPDRDYYLLDKPEQVRVREAYKGHIRKLLSLAKFKKSEIEATQKAVMEIETAFARASMSKEDIREPEKIYHKFSVSTLGKRYPLIDLEEVFGIHWW